MTTPENYEPALLTPSVVKKESSLAIVSLVTGILGWTFFPFIGSIVAVITGHLAKKEIRESGGAMSGDGLALAGLILGYTMIGLVVLASSCIITLLVLGINTWTPAFQ